MLLPGLWAPSSGLFALCCYAYECHPHPGSIHEASLTYTWVGILKAGGQKLRALKIILNMRMEKAEVNEAAGCADLLPAPSPGLPGASSSLWGTETSRLGSCLWPHEYNTLGLFPVHEPILPCCSRQNLCLYWCKNILLLSVLQPLMF